MLRLNVEVRFTDQIQRAKDFLGEQTCKQSNDITTLRENKKKGCILSGGTKQRVWTVV